jgi:hypothetical protein
VPEVLGLERMRTPSVDMPDGNHGEIFMRLLRPCTQQRPELNLVPERGVKAEAYRRGRARTDGFLAPEGHFRGHGEWSETDGALMAVDITSHDRDAEKLKDYAD